MTPELEGGLASRRGSVSRGIALLTATAAATLCLLATQFAASARAADTSQLCAGYSPCSTGSFTTHGYQYAADESWWAMYPGINCTNYAAFVESQVYGVPTPHLLMGDAYQWADRATEAGIPVDQTPTVGSVAVWGADAAGMGGYGHVAVVEAIGPNGSYIDISQSGMGSQDDGYDWERIPRAGGSWETWPSSFIHFAGPGIPTAVPHLGHLKAGAELTMAG
jgi:surface antigen